MSSMGVCCSRVVWVSCPSYGVSKCVVEVYSGEYGGVQSDKCAVKVENEKVESDTDLYKMSDSHTPLTAFGVNLLFRMAVRYDVSM